MELANFSASAWILAGVTVYLRCRQGIETKSSPTSRLFPGKDKTYFPHILHKHVDKTLTAVWRKGSGPGRDFFNSKGTLANSDRVRHHGYAQPTAVVLCCHAMLLIPQSPGCENRYVGGVTPPSGIALLVGNASRSVLRFHLVVSFGTRVVLGRRPTADLHPGPGA